MSENHENVDSVISIIIFRFMPPDDPLGRHGPSLDNFLSKKPLFPESKWQLCPYGKFCSMLNPLVCQIYNETSYRKNKTKNTGFSQQ